MLLVLLLPSHTLLSFAWVQKNKNSKQQKRWPGRFDKDLVLGTCSTKWATGALQIQVHRETVAISWDPLLWHTSTAITSCCSKIMHNPMLQGPAHNCWKPTCHPSSMFGVFWISRYGHVFKLQPISSNLLYLLLTKNYYLLHLLKKKSIFVQCTLEVSLYFPVKAHCRSHNRNRNHD